MDIQTLTRFLTWCTIINFGILLLWSMFYIFAPDLVYRTQSRWFPISRDHYNTIVYLLIGWYKILFTIFNVVPLLALLIAS